MSIKKKHAGFTLIEVLIVLLVLGILVAIILPLFSNSSDQAKVSASLQVLKVLRTQLHLAKVQHNEYFPNLGNGGDSWNILTEKTQPTSGPSGNYPPAAGLSSDVGPYLQSRPNNPFEDSNTVAPLGQASARVGFVYNQSTGVIKIVVSNTIFENLNLNSADFEPY